MNIHEYQAKSLLKRFKVPVSEGILIEGSRDGITFKSADQVALEATQAAEKLKKEVNPAVFVVKAQIHAGGRGKAGGVKVCKNPADVPAAANAIMGKVLVTPQTGAEGKKSTSSGLKAARTLKKNTTLEWFWIAPSHRW